MKEVYATKRFFRSLNGKIIFSVQLVTLQSPWTSSKLARVLIRIFITLG